MDSWGWPICDGCGHSFHAHHVDGRCFPVDNQGCGCDKFTSKCRNKATWAASPGGDGFQYYCDECRPQKNAFSIAVIDVLRNCSQWLTAADIIRRFHNFEKQAPSPPVKKKPIVVEDFR